MKIKWALNELNKYQNSSLPLNGTVDLEHSLKERDSEVISASPVQLNGTLTVEESSVYYADLRIRTQLVLPSSRSLEPVEVDIEFPFSEVYIAPDSHVSEEEFTEEEIVERLTEDVLDLQKPLEDAILTNKPSQVFTEEERTSGKMPSGKDWVVVEEDKRSNVNSSDEEGDPRFAALKDLFKEDSE